MKGVILRSPKIFLQCMLQTDAFVNLYGEPSCVRAKVRKRRGVAGVEIRKDIVKITC